MKYPFLPSPQGLYHPKNEHDGCGIGFVAHIGGAASHGIVEQALEVLCNLDHRGARGCEVNTGDGAGILTQIPDRFFRHELSRQGVELPERGRYGVAMLFLPPDEARRRACEQRLEEIAAEEGQEVLGWRDVPTGEADLGDTARSCEPCIRQLFIGAGSGLTGELDFERKLYVIGKRASHEIRHGGRWPGSEYFYFQSISCRTIVYKGMLTPGQVENYYTELSDPLLESAIVLVHSRFSTNTFPSWERAHPYRYLIHNGEINTLRGNENWMHTRQSMLRSRLFGGDLEKLFPVIEEDGSDSAKFDNCLEFLHLAGRSLGHAVMMMIPEPWEKHESMSDEKKAFYEYHACLMEPWDGPASIAFTDGTQVGAVLDRNGLRPSRYYVTADDRVIMGSEVGVLDVEPENVLHKGRLQPGRMFLVDTAEGRIIADEELKRRWATEHPYRQWLDEHLVDFQDLPGVEYREPAREHEEVLRRQQVFGFTFEDLRVNLIPMARNAIWPIGSMGNDAALAVLSDRPQPLFSYFKQLFAQVTNPPIDPIREELVTATETTLGSERNFLEPEPESCRQLRLTRPVLTNAEMAKLKGVGPRRHETLRAADSVPRRGGGGGHAAGPRRAVRRGRGGDRRRRHHPDPVRPRLRRAHGPDTGAAGGVRAAPPPDPRRQEDARRPRRRVGGAARGPPLLPAARVRRQRHQPVHGLREPRRPDPRGDADRPRIRRGERQLQQGGGEGNREGDVQDGHLDLQVVPRRADLRSGRHQAGGDRPLLHLDRLPRRGDRPRRHRRRGLHAPRRRLPAVRVERPRPRRRRRVPVAQGRGVPPVQPADRAQAAEGGARERLRGLQGVLGADRRPREEHGHPAQPAGVQVRRGTPAARRGGARGGDHPALQERGDVVRLDQQGGARGPRRGHEPHRRQEQHRRRGGGPGPLRPRPQRRLAQQRHQAGRFRPLRGDQQLPRPRPGAADQDGPGGQAGRRGRAARRQGLPLDSQGQAVDPGSRPDLAAAAPRHLLDRGPGRADPRPQELEPPRRASTSSWSPRWASARSPPEWQKATPTSS